MYATLVKLLLPLRAILGVLMLAFMLTAPATAWNVHIASNPSIEVDKHHHHGHNAEKAEKHDADTASDDVGKQRDGGHDHMPSLSAHLIAMVDTTPLLTSPSLRAASVFDGLIVGRRPGDPTNQEMRPPQNA